ncbi:hypothetical protein Hanom_Chr09g00786591 [Helianthus anomalus]
MGSPWVGFLSQTGFTGNFTVVPRGGWVTGFSPELVVDSGYSRSTPFVQSVPRKCSGLSLLAVQKKIRTMAPPLNYITIGSHHLSFVSSLAVSLL